MRLAWISAVAVALFYVSPAAAQVHWDVGAHAGAMKRVVTSRPPGGRDVGIGPIVGLQAHVAIMPLVRLGAYLDGELSPSDEPAARRIYSGGLRLKVTPPFTWGPRDAVRTWIFAGFGYAGVYAPSYHTDITLRDPSGAVATQSIDARGTGGYFFEIPVGVGIAWRFRKPWELTAELFGRAGIANGGTVYSDEGRPALVKGSGAPSNVESRVTTPGQDSWAIGLCLGIGLDL